jgi:quercetin dioxygenase-like cupin family protein
MRMPYQLPLPAEASNEIVLADIVPTDEREWVPFSDTVHFKPLCLNATGGYWTNLMRVKGAGVFGRHRHSSPVHGYVLKGSWLYLEHSWVAHAGSYVYEPPGETHTLVVPEGTDEMITLFHVTGVTVFVDPWGKPVDYSDVFHKIELCRAHYARVGFGADHVDQFIR